MSLLTTRYMRNHYTRNMCFQIYHTTEHYRIYCVYDPGQEDAVYMYSYSCVFVFATTLITDYVVFTTLGNTLLYMCTRIHVLNV